MARECKCSVKVDEALQTQGARLTIVLRLDGSARAVIATHKIDPRSCKPMRTLVATFCPFCGKKYAEPKRAAKGGE